MAASYTAENRGMPQDMFFSKQETQIKKGKECGNTVNVLLEFMHKSNNTKRNER